MNRIILFFNVLLLTNCSIKNNPTYVEDIAQIIHNKCSNCHRQGMIGHFDLLTYEDMMRQKHAIKQTVLNRLMPPWPANTSYTHFADELALSKHEIDLIVQWVDLGCPYGDSNKKITPPILFKGSMIGKPDITLPIGKIDIKGDFKDQFMLAKIPFTLPEETYARVIEFVPGNPSLVHHVNASLIRFEENKKKDVFAGDRLLRIVEDTFYKETYLRMGLLNDDETKPDMQRSVFNYLPGVVTPTYPAGIGHIRLAKKNAILLKDLHYGPSYKDTYDSSYINIFLSSSPPSRETYDITIGTLGVTPIEPELTIPPDTIMSFRSKYTLPEAISIINVNPHMHLLGQEFKAFALTEKGDTIRIVHIPKWDFKWQNFYKPLKPIIIPAGATVYALGTFDNTVNNPHNPNNPPQVVIGRNGSMRTSDEMFQLILTFMLYQKGDEELKL
jgi:hypothetical protein